MIMYVYYYNIVDPCVSHSRKYPNGPNVVNTKKILNRHKPTIWGWLKSHPSMVILGYPWNRKYLEEHNVFNTVFAFSMVLCNLKSSWFPSSDVLSLLVCRRIYGYHPQHGTFFWISLTLHAAHAVATSDHMGRSNIKHPPPLSLEYLGGVRQEISEKYFTWPREIYPPHVFFWASKRRGGGFLRTLFLFGPF